MQYERTQLAILESRIKEGRSFIQVVMGPRQVGKTTMISQLIKKIKIPYLFESADAIPAAQSNWISQIWNTVRTLKMAKEAPEYLLIIDEIQKIDNWSEVVKKEWDNDTLNDANIKVILLGSSKLLLQKGLSESLAGRFEMIYMPHWSFPEMQSAFDWNVHHFIYFGGYPGSAKLISDESRWKDYIKNSLVETTISKDILLLTRVDKPSLLKQLFEIGSYYSGQILSYNKILGQLQDAGNTTTLSGYLKLLADAGLLGGLEKYAGNIVRQRGSIPKFQVYNNALLSTELEFGFEESISRPAIWGRLTESSIGTHLINNSVAGDYKIFYWRERDNEVDFVLKKNHKLVAIEVKSGSKVANKGMDVFKEQFHPGQMLLVGTSGIPTEEFLKLSPVTLFK